ncbi:hypothetical protein AKJ09_09027 [Labilithrix luteola]|uniref:Uncharacterized protein n=1 Tax=Labilithrix luteola TaxID=1391654 RepID=A0A0K1Q9F4_9BACT|nr:outer membrane protein assembly factor BamD [Labilithrix luteola]AKV02364.1 hypothetical protein AKJ09_09027 [Labilithrix luteola]
MSDPQRLHEDEGMPDFDRALLRSARLDREPEDGAARALAALGIGAGGTVAAIAGEGTATPSAANGASVLGASAVTKGAAGLALLSGIVIALRMALAPAAPAPSSVGPATAPAPSVVSSSESPEVVESAPRAPVAEPTISVTDLPSANAALPRAGARPMVPSVAKVEPKSDAKPPSVAEEIALIDRARASLAAGDPSTAEHALDDHDARFANGTLALESKVARIELLVARGDSNAARTLAERFLVEHPRSAYDHRVRGLIRRSSTQDLNSNSDLSSQ